MGQRTWWREGIALSVIAAAVVGCGDGGSGTNPGTDAMVADVTVNDVAVDTADVTVSPDVVTQDAEVDAAVDAAQDVAPDAMQEAGVDAAPDITQDVMPDVAVDVAVDVAPADVVPADVAPIDARPADAGAPLSPQRASRFSTLGVRAWQSGSVRIVDDELEATPRLCGGSGAGFFCVSGGFVR